MIEIFANQYVILALTFGIYFLCRYIQARMGWLLLNPILISIISLIIYLKVTQVPFAVYKHNSELIDFWLKPAVVALGVPLYLQLDAIKKLWFPIILSLASKSVTTPIAMEVTQSVGGIPSLTAAVVVVTGILGALIGFKTLAVGRISSPIAQGLSMGTASHAVGASTAMGYGTKYGAFASLGITLNGIFTALLTPTIIHLIEALI